MTDSLFVSEVEVAASAHDFSHHSQCEFGLSYINEIVREALTADHLCVLAEGLGVHKVAAALLFCLDATGTRRYGPEVPPFGPENMVLLVNARGRDVQLILEDLHLLKREHPEVVTRGIQDIKAETVSHKRRELYAAGGVFAVSSRILTVDMITSTIDLKKVTGMVILNAHTVGETSKEAFIVQLLRNVNRNAFIKALSDQPGRVSRGINGLQHRLQALGVQQVSFWPRFRFEVTESLGSKQLEEVILEMDPRTIDIQGFLQDIIQNCLSQIKKSIKNIDHEAWTTDAVFSSDLHRLVRIQLEGVYHKISREARQAVSDLDQLQFLLHTLSNSHPCDWHLQLESIKLACAQGSMPSLWLALAASDALSEASLARVQSSDVPAKWLVLVDLLKELRGKRVLVMCNSQFTQNRLRELALMQDSLATRLHLLLNTKLKSLSKTSRHMEDRPESAPSSAPSSRPTSEPPAGASASTSAPPSKRRRVRGGAAPAPVREPEPQPEQDMEPEFVLDLDNQFFEDQPVSAIRQKDGIPLYDEYYPGPEGRGEIVFGLYSAQEILEKVRPDAVIMYEPNLPFVRSLEIHQKMHGEISVHFMYYQRSVEELIYLTSLRKEKDVFTSLIREKGNMAMVINDHQFHRKGEGELRVVNTRLAGGQTRTQVYTEPEKIIVDAREFMSDLPYLVWKQSIDVVPMTLEVGDYVLTPDCVVERKSISDLMSSFRDGRLYEQCIKMFKHYKQPVLLIEFSGDKAFSFDQFREISKAAASIVYEKLACIMLLFPKLKIIWSQSQRHTGEIFQKIKFSQPQPDPSHCAEVGRKVIVNNSAMDVLRAIPGITPQTADKIAEKLERLSDLADMSQADLAKIVGPDNARQITEFMDHKL